jgi:hypothetical protein
LLKEYNARPDENPLGLLPAYQLYQNSAYGRLVDALGETQVYILSAGWGLIPATFLTPDYDITFQMQAEPYMRRGGQDRYRDFRMLALAESSDVAFVGGKDYVPLFCSLTTGVAGRRIVFYNSDRRPHAPGCVLERFPTSRKTNWHYECAEALAAGTARPGEGGALEEGSDEASAVPEVSDQRPARISTEPLVSSTQLPGASDEAKVRYWVYENWVATNKAVLHTSTCGFCNDGVGTGRNTRGARNGRWHGPFASEEEAEAAAKRTGRPVQQDRCISRFKQWGW